MESVARLSAAFVICCLLPELAFSQAVSDKDKRDILKRATGSYYSLPKEGLASFRCAAIPNFEDEEAELREANPEAADAWLKQLAQIDMAVTVGADGKATVSRKDISDDNLKVIAEDARQTITNFFETWSPYVIGTVFPAPDGEYQLEDLGAEYRLSFKNGPASSVITLAKDFSVDARMITSPDLDSATWPQFSKTAKGFLPASIDTDLRVPANGGPTHVATSITYQEISGFQLPKTIRNEITTGEGSDEIEVDLTSCTATKR
jgi:hypothetical protein